MTHGKVYIVRSEKKELSPTAERLLQAVADTAIDLAGTFLVSIGEVLKQMIADKERKESDD